MPPAGTGLSGSAGTAGTAQDPPAQGARRRSLRTSACLLHACLAHHLRSLLGVEVFCLLARTRDLLLQMALPAKWERACMALKL